MEDKNKSKEKLIEELAESHKRISDLEQSASEHNQTDDILQASEIRYRRLFETAQDGILILDADTGLIIDVNPFLVNMLGYSHEEFLGKRLWEIGPFRDTKASKDSFHKLQTEKYVRYEDLPLQTKDGRHIEVEFVSNVYLVNQNQVIQCNIRDITARKVAEEALQKAKEELEKRVLERTTELRNANDQLQLDLIMQRLAEQALQKSEERYRMLFNSITDALFVLEVKADGSPGRFLEVNDVACDRLGYSRDELLTMSPSDIDAPASESGVDLLPLLSEQLTNGQSRIFEQVHIAKDGHRVPVEINARTFDMQGRLVNIKLARDISRRKQTEEEKKRLEIQLIQAHKIEALGKLAGGIAHDFKNILQPILINAELLSDLNPYGKQEREYLDEIIEAVQLGKNLVRQINQFGTRKKMYLKPIDLGQIVQDALTFIKRTLPPRITFRQWVNSKGSLVKTDPTQIYQLIINLCMNGVQAMNKGKGFLGVSLKETEVAVGCPAIVSDLNPGKYMLLTVRDTGCGISPEIQDRIFDPFFTTHHTGKGTGLGLSVVHEVIQNAEGSVLLHSGIGKGTKFKVFFPLYVETQEMLNILGPQMSGQGKDVLLVDDNIADLKSIHQLLVHLGYQVISTSDPQKALGIFRTEPDKFVLLITDQVMPRMKGLELATKVREIRVDVPIIICSGSEEALQELQNSRTDIHAYIHKPFSKAQLLDAMHRVLS
jgi:two-component system, cell cycle sensor histidine kinase and response regulator CckA